MARRVGPAAADRPRSWWVGAASRLARWPVLLGLAVLHLTVLPLVLDSPGHRAIALASGAIYLGLAALARFLPARRHAG